MESSDPSHSSLDQPPWLQLCISLYQYKGAAEKAAPNDGATSSMYAPSLLRQAAQPDVLDLSACHHRGSFMIPAPSGWTYGDSICAMEERLNRYAVIHAQTAQQLELLQEGNQPNPEGHPPSEDVVDAQPFSKEVEIGSSDGPHICEDCRQKSAVPLGSSPKVKVYVCCLQRCLGVGGDDDDDDDENDVEEVDVVDIQREDFSRRIVDDCVSGSDQATAPTLRVRCFFVLAEAHHHEPSSSINGNTKTNTSSSLSRTNPISDQPCLQVRVHCGSSHAPRSFRLATTRGSTLKDLVWDRLQQQRGLRVNRLLDSSRQYCLLPCEEAEAVACVHPQLQVDQAEEPHDSPERAEETHTTSEFSWSGMRNSPSSRRPRWGVEHMDCSNNSTLSMDTQSHQRGGGTRISMSDLPSSAATGFSMTVAADALDSFSSTGESDSFDDESASCESKESHDDEECRCEDEDDSDDGDDVEASCGPRTSPAKRPRLEDEATVMAALSPLDEAQPLSEEAIAATPHVEGSMLDISHTPVVTDTPTQGNCQNQPSTFEPITSSEVGTAIRPSHGTMDSSPLGWRISAAEMTSDGGSHSAVRPSMHDATPMEACAAAPIIYTCSPDNSSPIWDPSRFEMSPDGLHATTTRVVEPILTPGPTMDEDMDGASPMMLVTQQALPDFMTLSSSASDEEEGDEDEE